MTRVETDRVTISEAARQAARLAEQPTQLDELLAPVRSLDGVDPIVALAIQALSPATPKEVAQTTGDRASTSAITRFAEVQQRRLRRTQVVLQSIEVESRAQLTNRLRKHYEEALIEAAAMPVARGYRPQEAAPAVQSQRARASFASRIQADATLQPLIAALE